MLVSTKVKIETFLNRLPIYLDINIMDGQRQKWSTKNLGNNQ